MIRCDYGTAESNGSALEIRAIVCLLIAYVSTTLLQSVFGSLPINRLIGFALITLLAYDWISTKKSHLGYLVLVSFSLLFLRSLTVMNSMSQEVADWVYLASTLLFLALVSSSSARSQIYLSLTHCRGFIRLTVVFAVLLLLGLLVTRTGYVAAWGEEPYFKGLCNSEHTLASICILLLVLLIFLSRTGESPFVCSLCSLVVLFALLETGARTYLVPAAISVFLLIDGMVEQGWLKVVLMSLLVVSGVFVFAGSGMMNKFNFVQGNIYADSILSALTNGRNEIWATDIQAWLHSGCLGIVFGNSFSAIYSVNDAALTLPIWAHDDFIMVLYGTGILGLLMYVGCIFHVFKSMAGSVGNRTYFLLSLLVFFPLVLNGFFPYQHLVFAFVLLFVVCDERASANIIERSIGDGE